MHSHLYICKHKKIYNMSKEVSCNGITYKHIYIYKYINIFSAINSTNKQKVLLF